MIVRIMGEGQWDVADSHLRALNHLDDQLEAAVEGKDVDTFTRSLAELLGAVRVAGSPLPDDALVDSSLILPPADATLEEVRELLTDEGLIPG
ncbi:MAG: hypothetical protein WB441_14595 [Nocardioidaceae bacterium]